MKSKEFITEWVKQGKAGPFGWGIGNHFMQRLIERKIPWHQVMRIIKHIPYVKNKISQMSNFRDFVLRDEETGVELGCQLKTFGQPETRFIYMNTVMVIDHTRKAAIPVIIVNTTHES